MVSLFIPWNSLPARNLVSAQTEKTHKIYRTGKKSTTDTLSLVLFNDFHGSFQQDGKTPGAARLTAQIKRLQQTMPNVIVLAGGDNYSGGFFPRLTGGRPLAEMFELCQVEFSAVGNHEFDWGIPAMIERMSWGQTRYLAANIFLDSITGERPDWAMPYAIIKRTLNNGSQVRIAFIGLSTQETKTAALPYIVKDLQFAHPVRIAQGIVDQIRDSADLIFLLTHIGTRMQNGTVIFSEEGADGLSQIEGVCGIFTGHSHQEVNGIKDKVPVIQALNYGRRLGLMQFEITQDKRGKVHQRHLKNDILTIGESSSEEMQKIVEKYLYNPEYRFQEIICTNQTELIPGDYIEPGNFTRLGALVTQSYAHCYREMHPEDSSKVVLGVCNLGAIRTHLPQGEVTRLQAGNILPFGGLINAFELDGNQLFQLLQYGIECKAGWLQYHDMEIHIENGKITQATYLLSKGNGRITPIEIKPDGRYIVVTENFLSSGGDGYDSSLFTKKILKFDQEQLSHREMRNPTDVFIRYLQQLGVISTEKIRTPHCQIL